MLIGTRYLKARLLERNEVVLQLDAIPCHLRLDISSMFNRVGGRCMNAEVRALGALTLAIHPLLTFA